MNLTQKLDARAPLLASLSLAAMLLAGCATQPNQAAPAASGAQTAAPAGDLSGIWKGQIVDMGGNAHRMSLNIKVSGTTVTGTMTGGPPSGAEQAIQNGRLDGDQLSFTVGAPYKGTVSGNHIKGTLAAPGGGTINWEVSKQ